jgi:hypothetical protein
VTSWRWPTRHQTVAGAADPPTYLWQSVVCLVLFLPSALVALSYSTQVSRRLQLGDATGAVRASRLARTWCLVSLLLAFTLLFVLLSSAHVWGP